jgi:predicted GH43/DUF377 family glycosyl hydrolase
MMHWEKLGLLFCPDNNFDWMRSHAACPVAEPVRGSLYRVYFSCRDENNRSSIGFFELDMKDPSHILNISEEPVLSPGDPGLFDDSGVSLGCIVDAGEKKYLYYTGWNLGVTVPWRNSIGLAVAPGNSASFKKFSSAPILDRNDTDPYSLSYPWVKKTGSTWKMWYGSNLSWGPSTKDMKHVIKYAESEDGIHWIRKGITVINLEIPEEVGISKPCVLWGDEIHQMWYSCRGETYRIGYAESEDGMQWKRLDKKAGITVSPSGWDSEMVEYPFVFDFEDNRYMLYNGNGYGKSGVGLAVLKPGKEI